MDTSPNPALVPGDRDADIRNEDAYAALLSLPTSSIDAIVTDPPYAIRAPKHSFKSAVIDDPSTEWAAYADAEMLGQQSTNWHDKATHSRGYADNDPAHFQRWCELWLTECLRVLKPGGHLVAFGGTRTWHRLATAAENTGFEVRDSLAWMYATGFPKSHDVGAAVNRLRDVATHPNQGDAASTWRGWGTTLKPAFEPIVLARSPLNGTVAANVLTHGTGALNIDATRIDSERWPTNVFLDEHQTRVLDTSEAQGWIRQEDGRPSRFFWHAKPSQRERGRVAVDGVKHPTMKPVALMRELVRLVTPPGGTVLDPFAGSGTTVEAALLEGMRCIAFERDPTYIPLIQTRIDHLARRPASDGYVRNEIATLPQPAPVDGDEAYRLF